MSDWTNDFISQCLKDVPPGKYRVRAEAELRDHLECQRQVSTEAEVLRAMGDPERLRREYYIAWKQTPLGRANWIANGVVVIWGLMFVCGGLLALFGLSGKPYLAALFLISFPLGALFLRACFREERRRARWVTLGLLVEWVSVNSYFLFWYILLYNIPSERLAQEVRSFLPYLLLTFVGCLILGQLFGRKKEGRQELA